MLTAALAVLAYWLAFTIFNVPDDVGYVLMTIRKFDAGGSPYGDVYSQYGPGIFVLVGGFFSVFGITLGNDSAIFYNVALWLLSTLFAGLVLLRLGGRFLVAAAGLLVAFVVLRVDVNEPLHPGATIAFLLIALVLSAAYLLPGRPQAALVAIGALTGALISLKVNVGIFALVAIVFAAATTIPALRERRAIRVLAALVFVVLPLPLMSQHLGDSWAFHYAILVAAGSLGLALVSLRSPAAGSPRARDLWAGGAGLLAILLLVSVVPLIDGTSPGQLVQGWVVTPTHQADLTSAALVIGATSWYISLVGLWLVGLVSWDLRGKTERAPGYVLGALRLAAGLAIWASLCGTVITLPLDLTYGMAVGAPFLWVAAIPPPRGGREVNPFLRLLLPAMASLQFLHAYPIPGSQLVWSVFLLVPVGGICVADGLDELALALRREGAAGPLRALPALPILALVLFGAWLCWKPLQHVAREAHQRYVAGVPAQLAGAGRMRLEPALANQLEELTAGMRRHCREAITLPGMSSLNFFSERETPVELSSPWPFFLDSGEQRQIVDQVRGRPGLCLVRKPDLLAFWGVYYGGEPPPRPLLDYMERDFRLVHNYSGYELLVPRKPS